jgi:ubiquinol-cytochrome c reductase cytochrome b subunit
LHFILPLILTILVVSHLIILHLKGSFNPLGFKLNIDRVSFHPKFSIKDSITFIIVIIALILLSLKAPFLLGDPENFNTANPLNTPIHIQPE